MSCGCNNSPDCGCNSNPNDCQNPCSTNVLTQEGLSSELNNLILALFGTLTKTVDVNGRAIWVTPCSPYNVVAGFPRNAGEGALCYLLRIFPNGGGPPGPTGPTGPPGPAGSGAGSFVTVIKTADYTVAPTDGAVIAQPAAPMTLSLPSIGALPAGTFFEFWTNGAFNVTMAANGADVIKSALSPLVGTATYILNAPGEAIRLLSTAGVWYVE